jgi:hypothetical protein
MYQQLWGYKVEEKLYLGVREQKRLNTTDIDNIPEVTLNYNPRGKRYVDRSKKRQDRKGAVTGSRSA